MDTIGGYELDTIVTGDARELAKAIPDASFDLMVIDPPYFIPVQTYVGARGKGWERRTLGDMSILQTYFDVMFEEFARCLKSSASAYVFCDGQSYPIIYRAMFPHFKYVRVLVWDKIVSFNGYTWRHQHELIAWGEGYDSVRIPTGDGDILQYRGVMQEDRQHPAEKPIEIITRLIDKHPTAERIVDFYSGSGTVPAVCKMLGRHYLAFEIDAAIAERARERVRLTQPPLFVPEAVQLPLANADDMPYTE